MTELRPQDQVVFLVGPITGAGPWHDRAMEILRETVPPKTTVIVRPDRFIPIGETEGIKLTTPNYEGTFASQTPWEHLWIRHALGTGAVLAWLARQRKSIPNSADGMQEKAYGAITRMEIAELAAYPKNLESIAFGADPDHPEWWTAHLKMCQSGWADLTKQFDPQAKAEVPISHTLEETCARIATILRAKREAS